MAMDKPDPDPIIVLRTACATAGSQAAWARSVGLSPQYVTDLLAGRRAFTDPVLARLGLRRVERIQRREDAPPRSGPRGPFPFGWTVGGGA